MWYIKYECFRMFPSRRYEIRTGSNNDNTKVSAGYDPTPYQFSTWIRRKGMIWLILLKFQKQVSGGNFIIPYSTKL